MLRVIQFVIASGFISEALAVCSLYISGGGSSGRLGYWDDLGPMGAVCADGFDDIAADVACRQLGYVRSNGTYTYRSYRILICHTKCYGYEDKLNFCFDDDYTITSCNIDIDLTFCDYCTMDNAVGINCTNISPPTIPAGTDTTGNITVKANSLTTGAVAGIVMGGLLLVGFITTVIILCICCLIPTCPCYYRSHHTTHTVVVNQPAAPVVNAITATSAKTTKYHPPPLPVYDLDNGYQPYPAVPPTATTVKY